MSEITGSQNAQSVDDVIMMLVGMGFELEDCQQAIQAGKLTPDHAIEWILAGKPAVTTQAQAPTLRLGGGPSSTPAEMTAANPFAIPAASTGSPPGTNKPVSAADKQLSAAAVEADDKVVSRLHLSEEQRQLRHKMEEKQRLQAQKKAKEEKIAQKKAHLQALQQIKEDREARLQRMGGGTRPSSGNTTGTSQSKEDTTASTSQAGSTPGAEPKRPKQDITMIQVRLPDGRATRGKFSCEALLKEVRQSLADKNVADIGNSMLIQPFPRKEYGDEEENQSLQTLGLVPNGSLVLQKKPEPPKQESMDTTPPVEENAEDDNMEPEPAPPQQIPQAPPAGGLPVQLPFPPVAPPAINPPQHNWGAGNVVSGQEPVGQEEDEEMNQEEDNMEAENQEEDEIGAPPMQEEDAEEEEDEYFQNVPGQGQGHGGPGHIWGFGNQLANNFLEGQRLPHHTKSPKQLAADAARERYGNVPANPEGAGPCQATPTYSHSVILSLTQMVIQNISGRICDTRHPISGLQGLPSDLAIKILDYLIKERLLKPKTLQPFVSCHLQKLKLDCYPYTTNELLNVVRYHTHLSSLSMCSCPLITDKGMQSLKSLSRLKSLNIASCRQLTNTCIPIISEMRQLVTLILEDTGVTDEGIIILAESGLPQLQNLNLSRTQVTQDIIPKLSNLRNLRCLDLEQTQVLGLSGIQNVTKLSVLNLCNTKVSTDSLLCISQLTSLTALNIANTINVNGDLALSYISGLKLKLLTLPSRLTTTSEGMKHIANMPLQTLDLTNYINIDNSGIQYVGQINTLKKLRLENTKIDDEGMLYLEGLVNLEELSLGRTVVTDQGVKVVAAFHRLQELNLPETNITDELLSSQVLNSLQLLSRLNLAKTNITDKGLQHITGVTNLALINVDSTFVKQDMIDTLREEHSIQVVFRQLRMPSQSEDQ